MDPACIEGMKSVTQAHVIMTNVKSIQHFTVCKKYFKILYCVPKKRSHIYFLSNSVKNETILMIVGIMNPEGT